MHSHRPLRPDVQPGRPVPDERELSHDLAAEALELDPNDWTLEHCTAHLAEEHPQVTSWPDDNPFMAHDDDQRAWNYDHSHQALSDTAALQADPDWTAADAAELRRILTSLLGPPNPSLSAPAEERHAGEHGIGRCGSASGASR